MAELHVLDAEPRGADVIEVLEEALRQARAGQLSSVAVAAVYRDGCTQQAWSSAPSVSLLIGAAARLVYRLNRLLE
jgi:hypothetical protein